MRNFKQNIFLCFLIFINLFCVSVSFAGELKLETSIDRNKVAVGDSLQFNLTFEGSQNVKAPELPDIEGFTASYLGPSSRVSIVNGKVSSSVTHIYNLTALKVGTYEIGPFSFDIGGQKLRSDPVKVEVVKGSVSGNAIPRSAEVNPEALKDRVFVKITAKKSKAYVNEMIPVSVKVYVGGLDVRDIQYPQLDSKDFSVEQFGKPDQYRDTLNGMNYNIIEFKTMAFAVKTGRFLLGPAKISCNLILKKKRRGRRGLLSDDFFSDFFKDDIFDNFFGGLKSYPLDLESKNVFVEVLPLPEKGRPNDFEGALGNFNMSVSAEPTKVNVGDPITLKITIRGKGNFDTVSVPKLKNEEGFKVYEPQSSLRGSSKLFEQAVLPQTDQVKAIPEITFSFFDPQSGLYKTLKSPPIPIEVLNSGNKKMKIIEGSKVISETSPIKEIIGKDIVYIKSHPGKFKARNSYLYRNKTFLALQLIPIFLFLFLIVGQRRRRKLESDISYARRLIAPKRVKEGIKEAKTLIKNQKSEEFFGSIFKTLKEYLGNKFNVPSGGITFQTVEEILRDRGIEKDALERIKLVFSKCDMARFAPSKTGRVEMEELLNDVRKTVDYLERSKI